MINPDELLPVSHIRLDELYQSQKRVLEALANLLADDELGGEESTRIFETLIARERLGSTAIGHGIAIPHGRISGLSAPRAAMIRLREGIDFNAPDHAPVDLVFALIAPEDDDNVHLKILASLARMLSEPRNREALRNAQSPERAQAVIVEQMTTVNPEQSA
ncbi:MAG TPA: PTS sugar transporter subunit IIA [Halothiobacillus sp.]|nr:PTS sugar transporter subunit IIA [Halothiobacillus sp.]